MIREPSFFDVDGHEYFFVGCKMCLVSNWQVGFDGKRWACLCKNCGAVRVLPVKPISGDELKKSEVSVDG